MAYIPHSLYQVQTKPRPLSNKTHFVNFKEECHFCGFCLACVISMFRLNRPHCSLFLFLQVMITTFQTETKEAVFWNKASSQHKRKSTTTTLKQWNVGDEENHLVTVTASCWQSQAKYYKIVYIDPVWFNHRLRDKSTIHMSRFIIHQTDFWLVQSANTFWMLSICVESFTLICVDDEKSFMEICLWSNKSRIKSRRQTL